MTRSLIASWVGNLVGALIVALPATYFYLSKHTPIPGTQRWFREDANRLRGAEEGEAAGDRSAPIARSRTFGSGSSRSREVVVEKHS